MFDVAMLVADAMRDIERRDGEYLQENEISFNASFIVGGQISGEPLRLFRIYSEGNFIEAGLDTPYFQTGETKYGKPIIDRVITPFDAPCRRHEVRARVVRFDHAQQPVGGHADRPDLLRTRQPRSAEAAPVRRRRRLFHRTEPRMERRHATGISPVARAALVTGRGDRLLPHHLRTRRQPHTRALSAAVSGATSVARLAPRVRSRCAGHGKGTGQGLRGAARDFDRQPPAGRPQSLDRSSAPLLAATRGVPATVRAKNRRATLPALSRASRASRRAISVARPARDPHFVAQLHAGVGRQGATRRRGFAL